MHVFQSWPYNLLWSKCADDASDNDVLHEPIQLWNLISSAANLIFCALPVFPVLILEYFRISATSRFFTTVKNHCQRTLIWCILGHKNCSGCYLAMHTMKWRHNNIQKAFLKGGIWTSMKCIDNQITTLPCSQIIQKEILKNNHLCIL